jgi:hypothetical protein
LPLERVPLSQFKATDAIDLGDSEGTKVNSVQ